MNRRQRQFNSQEVTLVVSGWPEKGRQGKNHGMAWYTKESLVPQAREYDERFVVLSEKNHDNDPFTVAEGKILVWRVFDDNRSSLYPQILSALSYFPKIKRVMVHSEFGAKGGVWHFALLIPFLFLIRMTGKKITYFSHNVIDDVGMLSGHLGFTKGSLKHKVLNLGLKAYYAGLRFLVDKIVVLDEALKTRLMQFVPEDEIVLLPIPIEKNKLGITKIQAKRKLGIAIDMRVLLYFGFMTWYKGADWLVDTFTSQNDGTTHLLMAGGASHSMGDKAHYKKYYDHLEGIAQKDTHITLTGFVPEQDVSLMFAAADLVIFPYRGMMGASGSLALALSYQKPVMLSNAMQMALNNDVVATSLEQVGWDAAQLTFTHSKSGMQTIMNNASSDSWLNTSKKMVHAWMQGRSKSTLTQREQTLIYKSTNNFIKTESGVAVEQQLGVA
jgi:glycosyltransferase involved in cell wall biosynthesis